MLYALIPVKGLGGAKSRLAGVLDVASRRDLVVAMYRDVLAAAMACTAIDRVAVVSGDSEALAMAEAAGAEAVRESAGPSAGSSAALNDALTSAAKALATRGIDRLLILFADLPLANTAAIERLLHTDADVALVRAADGGTNAFVLTPGAIEFQFGPDSSARHIAAAEHAGLRVERLDEPSLALDVDQEDDLELLRRSSGIGQHTVAVLQRIARQAASEQR